MIIIGVSGGVDSMVLLDKLYKEGHKIVIAHVNYQKRPDSFNDEIVIKKYIEDKDIIFEKKLIENYNDDNFQAQARHLRYDFYLELASKYKVNEVYLAHHKDDYLETYLFKKERTGLYEYYGIKEETTYQNVIIKRPLLSFYKEDLINYALDNKIDYYEDSSNSTLDYTRNIIRDRLSKLSLEDKEKIFIKAEFLNREVNLQIEFVNKQNEYKIEKNIFLSWQKDIQRRWLFKQIKKYDITIRHLDDIISKIEATNSFKDTILDTTIVLSYGNIYMLDFNYMDYYYIIKEENDYIKIKDLFLNKYNYKLKETSYPYPYVIRPYNEDDFISLKSDYKRFRTRIKKNRIPTFLRDYLPVIEVEGRVQEFI
ncbi:MAG: tRNA lysidine(34) synthetase TilS [Erysipelotrichales bacterium]